MKPKNAKQKPEKIQHVILSNGYRQTHCISTMRAKDLERCRRLLPGGGRIPKIDKRFHVVISGAKFLVIRCACPILVGGIGRGQDSTWDELTSLLDDLGQDYQGCPHPRLWLAVVLLPAIAAFEDDEVRWMYDFQRHLAAAMFQSGILGSA